MNICSDSKEYIPCQLQPLLKELKEELDPDADMKVKLISTQ